MAKMVKKAKVATSALYVEVRFRRPRFIPSADMYSVTDVSLSICAGMDNVPWLDYPLTLDSLFVFSSNKTMKYVLDAVTLSEIAFGTQKLKVSKFQKQIFLFSFEPKTEQKLFFDFCPKDLKWVK